ncbi:MAG: hypothetical protein KDB00_28425, partial [Planctomycetales bacterium]|nr:hypothetical protein [Planctomycetales bacterium]
SELTNDITSELRTGNGSEFVTVYSGQVVPDAFRLNTGGGDDRIHLADSGLRKIDGGEGFDRVSFNADSLEIDLTETDWNLENIEAIDLRSGVYERLHLSPTSVARSTGIAQTLDVYSDNFDDLRLGDEWVLDGRGVVLGDYFHRLSSNGVEVRLFNRMPLTNPLLRHDVDGSGQVSPIDALQILNMLALRGTGTQIPIEIPASATGYFDVSQNGEVSPLDALQVINFLALQMSLNDINPESVANNLLPLRTGAVAIASIVAERMTEAGTAETIAINDTGQPFEALGNRKRFSSIPDQTQTVDDWAATSKMNSAMNDPAGSDIDRIFSEWGDLHADLISLLD